VINRNPKSISHILKVIQLDSYQGIGGPLTYKVLYGIVQVFLLELYQGIEGPLTHSIAYKRAKNILSVLHHGSDATKQQGKSHVYLFFLKISGIKI
jgi:hypothetical protein